MDITDGMYKIIAMIFCFIAIIFTGLLFDSHLVIAQDNQDVTELTSEPPAAQDDQEFTEPTSEPPDVQGDQELTESTSEPSDVEGDQEVTESTSELPDAQDDQRVAELTNKSSDARLHSYPQIERSIELILEYNSLVKSDIPEDEKQDYLANSPIEFKIDLNPNVVAESELLLVYEGEDDGFREFGRDFSKEGLLLRLRFGERHRLVCLGMLPFSLVTTLPTWILNKELPSVLQLQLSIHQMVNIR